jgi:2-polyprenyl-3-methyl-5-hydroxy-6-metoxy-1,4-benzoquinol methylase
VIDIDEVKIGLARREARAHHLGNVEFRVLDIAEDEIEPEFDFVYSRFVLTHLRDPGSAVARMYQSLRPGGVLAVTDIDFRAYFSYPESTALQPYVELYNRAVERRGADATSDRVCRNL